MSFISANSRLITQGEQRLSTLMRDWKSILYGSKHPKFFLQTINI